MNNRIHEIAEQAMIPASYEFGGTYMAFSKEKFAELIVRECMGLVDGYTYPVQTQPYTIYHIASEAIKQHFGVEA